MHKTKKKRKPTVQKGQELLNQVINLTGIPSIKKELTSVLENKNIDIKNLTLDQLRVVAASYLREIMSNIRDKNILKKHDSSH